MTVIGLSGYAGAGKDTVGKILCDHHGFRRVSFADRLKALAVDLDPVLEVEADLDTVPFKARLSDITDLYGGLENAKNEVLAVRQFLQDLGTKARNHLGENVWVNAAVSETKTVGDVVVTDVRFPNEARAIKSLGGQVWRVNRPGHGPVNGHASESALDDWKFDAIVENAYTVWDLEAQVAAMVGYLNIGAAS